MADTSKVIVSYSELSAFRQCPLLHEIQYVQRWTKPVEEGRALDKGIRWHNVMERHWKIIKEWDDAHKSGPGATPRRRTDAQDRALLKKLRDAILPTLYDTDSGAQSDTESLVQWMYEGWLEAYGTDRDVFRPLAIEHPMEVPLLDAFGNPSRYHIKARLDLIGLDLENGVRRVVDHKSGANLPDKESLEINDQFALYVWMLRQAGKRVAGSHHWGARTTRNQADFPGYSGKAKPQTMEQRFRRTPVEREDVELTNIALDAYNAARAAYPDDETYRPTYSSPDPRQCGWKCDIMHVHLAARKGYPMQRALLDAGFHVDRTRH